MIALLAHKLMELINFPCCQEAAGFCHSNVA
jgi:hypothetical protein